MFGQRMKFVAGDDACGSLGYGPEVLLGMYGTNSVPKIGCQMNDENQSGRREQRQDGQHCEESGGGSDKQECAPFAGNGIVHRVCQFAIYTCTHHIATTERLSLGNKEDAKIHYWKRIEGST